MRQSSAENLTDQTKHKIGSRCLSSKNYCIQYCKNSAIPPDLFRNNVPLILEKKSVAYINAKPKTGGYPPVFIFLKTGKTETGGLWFFQPRAASSFRKFSKSQNPKLGSIL